MVDGADADAWSDVAEGWAALWGRVAAPAWTALIEACAIRAGTRVLDVGCGSGEFLGELVRRGAAPTGVDPAPDMVRLAARHASAMRGDAEDLPFPDDAFEVVTAINALQFAEHTAAALREFARVAGPEGRIGIAVWAEGARNDIDVIERAVSRALDEEVLLDGPLRSAGGLEVAFAAAGLDTRAAGEVPVPWRVPDDDALVRGILLGEDEATMAELRGVVVAAAAPFRRPDGGYVLRNVFRWAVASSE